MGIRKLPPQSPRTRPRRPPQIQSPVFWRGDEVQYLVDHQDDELAEVAHQLGRTVNAVRGKRSRLIREGQIRPRGSRWSEPGSGKRSPMTEAELAMFDDLRLSAHEVAQRIGRSADVVRQNRRRRGIGPWRPPADRWTPEEDATILENLNLSTREVAHLLSGRTVGAIDNRRSHLRHRLREAAEVNDMDESSG